MKPQYIQVADIGNKRIILHIQGKTHPSAYLLELTTKEAVVLVGAIVDAISKAKRVE